MFFLQKKVNFSISFKDNTNLSENIFSNKKTDCFLNLKQLKFLANLRYRQEILSFSMLFGCTLLIIFLFLVIYSHLLCLHEFYAFVIQNQMVISVLRQNLIILWGGVISTSFPFFLMS